MFSFSLAFIIFLDQKNYQVWVGRKRFEVNASKKWYHMLMDHEWNDLD